MMEGQAMMMNKATSRKDQLDPRQGDGQQPSFPPGPTVPDPGYGAEAVHHRDEHAGGRPEQDHERERQHADRRHRLDLMDLVLDHRLSLRRQERARGASNSALTPRSRPTATARRIPSKGARDSKA